MSQAQRLYSRSKAIALAKKMDGYYCQIGGMGGPNAKSEVQGAHVVHAGSGGNPKGHDPFNIITLATEWHRLFDLGSRAGPLDLRGFRLHDIQITKWDRRDRRDGLHIKGKFENGWRDVPKRLLYFYLT